MFVFLRSVLLYLILVLGIRLLGKRQVGQMGPSEFVVTMLAADLVSIPMEDTQMNLLRGLLPLLAVLGAEMALSLLTLKFRPLRRLLLGRPVILVENGKLVQENLRKTRVSVEELMEHLRLKDAPELNQIRYAILETNGSVSVFLQAKDRPASAKDACIKVDPEKLPIWIIQDGQLDRNALNSSGKDQAWLDSLLKKEGLEVKTTFLLGLDSKGKPVVQGKEQGQNAK